MHRYLMPCFVVFALMLVGCSGSTSSGIESAEFHLDAGEYDEAIEILTSITEDDPTNILALRLLASGYFGRGFVGDSTALGIFADYLEGKSEGKSNLETIADNTPAAANSGQSDIFAADTILQGLTDEEKTTEGHLLHGFVHLAIITIVGVVKIGATSQADECDYDFAAVNDMEENRFRRSLDQANDSFEKSGIENFDETGLGEQIIELRNDVNNAADLQTFFGNEYDQSACP